ncbi:MAG: glycosyl transferase group 1 [Cyanobacteria bacterium RYN_339]|nr:glycosyl transferase group 1 [Cyanobacteria bacterium RYN_339]
MKVLLVSERTNVFLGKCLDQLGDALRRLGAEPIPFTGEPYRGRCDAAFGARGMDEHRFLEAFRAARELGAERLHHIFLMDPQRLQLALEAVAGPLVSFSHFGLAAAESPIVAQGLARLIASPAVSKVLIHSIAPDVARGRAEALGLPTSAKVAFVHDPMYDPTERFALGQAEARRALGLPLDRKIVLYFGTYYAKRGADLLHAAAAQLHDRPDAGFWFVGSTRTAPPGFAPTPARNVVVVDREVDDEEAARWIAAADLVVQPYRRVYTHDTSGVLVQAAQAGRRTIVPAISPFQETVARYGLGRTFPCEDVDGLAAAVRAGLDDPPPVDAAGYLAGLESWDDLARLVLA